MIAVHLNPNRRIRQGVFPTPLICGASVPVPHEAVRPLFVTQKDAATWVNTPFLMTCIGNSQDPVLKKDVSWFIAAFHAVDFVGIKAEQLPRDFQATQSDSVTWEWMSRSIGSDLVLIKVSGFAKWPHPSVPLCRETATTGLRGCTISQGERETENGTPGSGTPIFWNDEKGEPGPFGFKRGYANPILPRWGEGRVISVNLLQFFAGPNRNDDYPGMNTDNSSAPFIAWNAKNSRWELLGVTLAISDSFRTPDGIEYWEDGRNGGPGPLVTATPEGLWKLVGGGLIQRSWADGAVPFVIHNNVAPVVAQIEGLMGSVVLPPEPTTPLPQPMVTQILLVGALRNEYSGFDGCKIRVGPRPITITSLGRWKNPGNSQLHPLRLVDMAGNDMASTLVAMTGTDGEFKYGDIPSPVVLAPFSDWYLVSGETAGKDYWMNWDCKLQTTADVRIEGLAWFDGRWNFAAETGKCYGPVSLQYLV